MKKLFLALLMLLPAHLAAQGPVLVRGKVLDITNLSPLYNATVIIEGTSIGVATNKEGDFELNIPGNYADSLVKVSYIGYNAAWLTPGRYKENEKTIYLEPLEIVLGDVIVKAKKTTAEEIVKKAIWSIPGNYMADPNMLKCFYREVTYINDEEVLATEALLDVYKTAYSGIREEDQVKVSKVRQVGGNPSSGFDFEGGAYYRISDDVIANRPGFLEKESLQYYKFSTNMTLGKGDETVFVIDFSPDRGAINRAQADHLGRYGDAFANNLLSYSGKLYIREADQAIIKVEYWLDKERLGFAEKKYLTRVPDDSNISLSGVSFSATYRKYKGKYYLGSTNGQISFRISNRDIGISQDYRVFNELLTVDRAEKGILQFRAGELTGKKDLVPAYHDRYEEDFWKDENIMQAYSSLRRLGNRDDSALLFKDMLRDLLNNTRRQTPREQLFLHTDRNSYITGDNIFFKAYVTELSTGFPSYLSKTFFVILADSLGNTINKSRFGLDKGTGHGNISIPSELEQGVYNLISYPCNAQNFEADNSFVQSLVIEDKISFIKGEDRKSRESLPKGPGIEDTDISFLPEGGHLVEGYSNNIAFCALSSHGAPVKLSMLVKDDKEKILDTITTGLAGLGSFRLVPRPGRSYYASVIEPGGFGHLQYKLPPVSPAGLGMELIKKDHKHLLLRLFTASRQKEELDIILVKGSEILCHIQKEISGSNITQLDFDNRTAGIGCLTVFRNGEPVAERLIFLDNDSRPGISDNLQYGSYAAREKMKVRIRVTDRSGNPVQANLSASFVDSINCISGTYTLRDIRYAFWLRSCLKDNTPANIPMMVLNNMGPGNNDLSADLDLLLLTYGWRKYAISKLFEEKHDTGDTPLINYDIFNGRISPLKAKKKITTATEVQVFNMETYYSQKLFANSSGNFTFSPESFLLDKDLIWNFADIKQGKKWKLTIGNPENRSFIKDALQLKPHDYGRELQITEVDKSYSFDPGLYIKHIQVPEVTVKHYTVDRTEDRKRLARAFENIANVKSGGPEELEGLPDLESIIYKIQRPTRIIRTNPDPPYNPVFWVYFRSPNSWGLRGTSPRACFVIDDVLLSSEGDGLEARYMSPQAIDRVSIITGPQAFTYFGEAALGGAIMIYTKDPGEIFFEKKKDPGLLITKALCDPVKEFYVPDYDSESIDTDRADYRLTIHWEPEIKTDINGEATIEFFNAGYNSYVTGIIQGISKEGEPVSHRLRYITVKE